MSKVYEVLSGLSPQLREEAREILDAMLASGDIVNWDRQHRLMLDNRSLPNTDIVDLVAHLLHPHDERIEEPKAFSLFVQALKDIKLESEWVQNELVKDMLDDASDSSDSEDESDDGDDGDDDNNENDDDDDDSNNENDDDDNNNNENEDDDDGDNNSGDDVDETSDENDTVISTQL